MIRDIVQKKGITSNAELETHGAIVKKGRCPKCNSHNDFINPFSFEYCTGIDGPSMSHEMNCCLLIRGEHLHIKCMECGWVGAERCADASC